ncbi:MAG: hypothetical protein HQ559_11025 [Lentisphaerae bacterium]|nr:hypothetical protein [Lentisphaerota bacterium]
MSATVEDVLRVLEEQGIAFDTNKVFRAAAVSALRAVDARGMILPAADLERMTGGDAIERDETWESGIGYLKVGFVSGQFAEVVEERLHACSDKDLAGLVLDLRGSGGSGLDAVDRAAGMFVETDEVLYTVEDGRGEVTETHKARQSPNPGTADRVPVMLLVDGTTGAAGELLAAVLKGRAGIMLVGRKTMGDPALRIGIALPEGEVAWLATRWVVLALEDPPPSADGAAGSGEASEDEKKMFDGVVPDIEVSTFESAFPVQREEEAGRRPMSEEAKRDNELMKRVGDDAILRRAVDILLGLQAIGQRGAHAEEPVAAEEPAPTEGSAAAKDTLVPEELVPEDK